MSGSTSLVCMATSLRFTESAVTVMPPASGQPTTRHFQSIAAFHHYLQWPPPEHPLLGLVSLAQMESQHISTSQPLRNDFYMVTLKNVLAGNMTYGRTRFDFSNGTMLFHAPGQVVQWEDMVIEKKGFIINIHADYLKGHPLAERIRNYHYFAYTTHEALHISPREEVTLLSLYQTIEAEYTNNQDALSREIILGLLDTLLRYAERFYRRQFLHRAELQGDLGYRLHQALVRYFASGDFYQAGIPSVERMASLLSVSPRYLSDALKAETGKTAIEHIHGFLIEEAKNLLLERNKTVAEVAYQLGFEYPQYFSRLFKAKVGVSPTAFQKR